MKARSKELLDRTVAPTVAASRELITRFEHKI